MRFLIIFITLCLIRKSIQKLEPPEEKATQSSQILRLKRVLWKHYSLRDSDILVFSRNSNNIENSLFELPLFIVTEWEQLRKMFTVDGPGVIIFLEGKADQDFDGLEHLRGIIIIQPVLIVCIADAVCSSKMYMQKILETVDSGKLHYVALNDEGIIDIYAYSTTAEGSCGIAQLFKLVECPLSGESVIKNCFHQLVNMHKCPLRFITWGLSSSEKICEFQSMGQLCAIERQVVELVAKRVNATSTLLTVETPTDVKVLIGNRYGDLGYRSLDTRPSEGITYSLPYLIVRGTVIASHSTWISQNSFIEISLPFKYEVWVGIGVVIVSIFFLRILVPYFRRLDALSLYGTVLGIAVPGPPPGLPSRICFISLVLFGYVCVQSYLAARTQVLSTLHRDRIIKNLNDLENSNLRVSGTAVGRERFKHDYPRIYRDFEILDYVEYHTHRLDLLAGRSKPLSMLYVENLDSNIVEWKNVRALDDDINWYLVTLMLPNSSTILTSTNIILMQTRESGYVSALRYLWRSVNSSMESNGLLSTDNFEWLQLHQLRGAFFLLIVGWTLSFFVLLIELITAIVKKKLVLRRLGEMHSKWFRRRPVRGILLPVQTSRCRY